MMIWVQMWAQAYLLSEWYCHNMICRAMEESELIWRQAKRET